MMHNTVHKTDALVRGLGAKCAFALDWRGVGARSVRVAAAVVLAALLLVSGLTPALSSFTLGLAGGAQVAHAATSTAQGVEDLPKTQVSADGAAATLEGSSAKFALDNFSRAQKGTNSTVEAADGSESYAGYRYYVSNTAGSPVAIGMNGYVVVYVPEAVVSEFGIDLADDQTQKDLMSLIISLDAQNANGGDELSAASTWHFTSDTQFVVGGVQFQFDREVKAGQIYACVMGTDGSDITSTSNPAYNKPTHADMFSLVEPAAANIVAGAGAFEQAVEFLTTLDWSPLWITLKTTGVAIIFIFVLGLAAAYFTLHISPRAQNIFDSIFTIPMVLPPTVCGFVLLYLCGSKTAFGKFFIDIGFPLIFSWPATVIAAVVVAFPLMYRNARGAFENLDPNMLDAARTLGWKNSRIFFKLMLPLSWSSIAAATVLAFARALGEFGATLFLAGNYLGITRTIPIAIYFEWMNGNDAVAWFWVAIIIVFSFVVILFINLWSRRTTRYRKRSVAKS